MDAIGYTAWSGRREGIVDRYAPWLYRLSWEEITRESKIDGVQTFPMTQYLFADVYASGVDGWGDATCGSPLPQATGGFVLRVHLGNGTTSSGSQMTATYFGGTRNVKRLAVPLAPGVGAADVTALTFDAYDADGIYLLAIGDVFVVQPSGANGATIAYVRKGQKPLDVYVDDASVGCVDGVNTSGGTAYPCVGGQYTFVP